MLTTIQKQKLEKMCQMIFEVASGNFSYRIERSGREDELEGVIVLLNMMAEEIRESFHHFALVNPHETYKQIAQMSFLIDRTFRIRNYNLVAQKILRLKEEEIYGKYFYDFLTEDSRKTWDEESSKILEDKEDKYFHTIRLFLSAKNSLTVPALCSISSLKVNFGGERFLLVTALQTIVQSREKEEKIQKALHQINNKKKKNKQETKSLILRERDKRQIQKVYDYILDNLEKPLPSLKQLAHQENTNEYKLKVGFRQLYNTSVFRFQREQRLKMAHSYIINSDLPLTRISEICGFKSVSHFSKLFKNQYGFSPRSFRKSYLNNT